jgi:DNA repair exonuclease SbcCD ATPase subunit
MARLNSTTLLVALLCAMQGCTIAGQYSEIKDTQHRVDVKTDQLQHEENTQADLQTQARKLSDDLSARQLNASQLDARLAALQAQNRQLASSNDKKRRQREALNKDLAGYRAEITRINQANATAGASASADAATSAQQQAQLDELKKRVRARLASMAND